MLEPSHTFARGRGRATPLQKKKPGPRFFKPCKLVSKHMSLFETHHASIEFANGAGLRPPQPPRFFKPCKLVSKHMSLFETHHASIEFANGGGLRPPQPPRFFPGGGWGGLVEAMGRVEGEGGGGGGGGGGVEGVWGGGGVGDQGRATPLQGDRAEPHLCKKTAPPV